MIINFDESKEPRFISNKKLFGRMQNSIHQNF